MIRRLSNTISLGAPAWRLKTESGFKVSSHMGKIKIKAKISPKVNRGVIFIRFHLAEAAANVLSNPACDPVAKIPEYKVRAVKVEKLAF